LIKLLFSHRIPNIVATPYCDDSADGPPEVIPSYDTSSIGYFGSKRLRVKIEVEVEDDQFIVSFSFISILS